MTKIGLLSDTHTFFHPEIPVFFKDVDEIWHAGDIGNLDVVSKLQAFKPLRAVYGNIDGHEIRMQCPEILIFDCEDMKVMMMHIGGYPGHYTPQATNLLKQHNPDLFITGHSHILKVIYDKKHSLLHVNPGAAGKSGWHQLITLIRFTIDRNEIQEMEIRELKRGGMAAY